MERNSGKTWVMKMVELQDLMEMFEKNPLAHTVVDANQKILIVNDAFCKMVGYSKDRLLAIRFSDFRDQQMIKYLKNSGESVTEAISSRHKTIGESTLETPSGIHVVLRTNMPLLNEKGEVKLVYVTYNEITGIVKTRQY